MDRTRMLISLTKYLYYLVKTGAPLEDILNRVKKDAVDKEIREAAKDMEQQVSKGVSLAAAMSQHPNLFPSDYTALIEAAENTQTLPQVLKDLALHLESVETAGKHIRNAALYPGLIINFLLVFVFIIWYSASDLFFNQSINLVWELGKTLSPVAWFFIYLGKIFFSPFFIIILSVFVLLMDIILFTKSTFGTGFFMKLPMVGDIVRKSYTSRISRALGFMLKEGITLEKSLEEIKKTTNSKRIEQILDKAKHIIAQGKPLSEAFNGELLFDNTYIFMLKKGEEEENLPDALIDAADYYDEDLKGIYDTAFKLAEPLFLFSTGIIIALIIISLVLPFYSVLGVIN